jgi:hypothetical protein
VGLRLIKGRKAWAARQNPRRYRRGGGDFLPKWSLAWRREEEDAGNKRRQCEKEREEVRRLGFLLGCGLLLSRGAS